MIVRHLLLVFGLISFSTGTQALERRYLASMDVSIWVLTETSATVCRIEHQIPRFGSAIFTRQSGRRLQLELQTRHKFVKGVNVELRSEASSWNSTETRSILARFETSGGNRLFKIPATIAEQTYNELRDGYQPGFLFYDDDPLIASLSTVRFGSIDSAFSQCVDRLYRHNFNDIRVSNIHFEPDEEFASLAQESSAFVNMLNYLQIDNAVSEIVITGHTDNTGLACYNQGLSERRAWYVYDLLIAQGIESNLLRVDFKGEHLPLRKAGNKKSHAGNRRVSVELRR